MPVPAIAGPAAAAVGIGLIVMDIGVFASVAANCNCSFFLFQALFAAGTTLFLAGGWLSLTARRRARGAPARQPPAP